MSTLTSTLNGKTYNIKDLARVPDRRLQLLYVKHGLRPVDIYVSMDNDGRDIMVMLFNREESKDLYKMWLNHTLV